MFAWRALQTDVFSLETIARRLDDVGVPKALVDVLKAEWDKEAGKIIEAARARDAARRARDDD